MAHITPSTGQKVAVGVGLAAGAALAYYLYGTPGGAKTRTKIRGWMLRARGEVLEKLEQLQEINQEIYNKVVDSVLTNYQKIKDIDAAEIDTLATRLKGYWRNIQRHLPDATAAAKPKRRRPKAASKASAA